MKTLIMNIATVYAEYAKNPTDENAHRAMTSIKNLLLVWSKQ